MTVVSAPSFTYTLRQALTPTPHVNKPLVALCNAYKNDYFIVSLTTAGEASMPDEYSKHSGVLCEALHPKCSFLS